jgi:N-acetylated-alpha-linked acidic dipeptidase
MKRHASRSLALAALAAATLLPAQQRLERFMGYSPAATAAQKHVEAKYQAIPSAEAARHWHRYFTSEPHPAGSPRNNELAQYIAEQWRAQGWEDVHVRQYDVLSSYPREVLVEMSAPRVHRFTLREVAYDVDPDTKHPAIRSGYLGFSASGEVTAPVIYAFSGNPQDYAYLRQQGIDPKGKIALVRYSNPYSYRGFKALTAQRQGCAGLIIYSDPMEDGFARGKVFPDGPWGPESHIQRGAITYDFIVPGDPLTPGWASLPGARRIPMDEAQSVPRIMAVPMSWREARLLLESMDGPEAPREWHGGMPIKYRLGGAAVQVHLKVDMDTSVLPNFVVEARIRGADLPDEWIVLGNHRDAWEFGGVDPSSGTAAMMEMTRALGQLKRQGIRPRRTLVVCSWDGEELALTGSTEWGEHFAAELKRKAVAYLNVDSAVAGPHYNPSAVASLAPLLLEVSGSVAGPDGRPLLENLRAYRAAQDSAGGKVPELVDVRIGSGSDHTVFLNHLGVPTVGLEFEGPYGVYHSAYDNFYRMDRIADPGFFIHRTMAQLWGILALRLANAEALPFDFAAYAQSIRGFVRDLERAAKITPSQVDLQPLQRATVEFQTAGRALAHHVEHERLRHGALTPAQAAALNRAILAVERNWLNPDGIPGRPWFKHLLYAARYTYAHLELPGLTEAVEARDWKRAAEQARRLEAALQRNTELLQETLATLERRPALHPKGVRR